MPSPSLPSFAHRRHLLRAATAVPTALLLAACGGGGSDRSDPLAPPSAIRVTDRRVPVAPGVSLHVRDWQSGRLAGPTFVLLPGFGASAAHFDSLARALAQRGRAIAISCRGFGRSDKPLPDDTHRYDTGTLVDDVHAVLQALGVDRIVLGGHSMAGNQVTLFAGRYPERVRGLVYLDTNFDYTTVSPDDSDDPSLAEPSPTEADTASVAAMIAFNRRLNRNWSAPMEADLVDKLEVKADGSVGFNTPDAVAAAMYVAGRQFSPDYKAVRVPALVLTALPGDWRDMCPWLATDGDARTKEAANAAVRLFNSVRAPDADRLFEALPAGSQRALFQPATHVDFFIEREAEVLRLVDGMGWR
ncbi:MULTISPECIES: alpha/beta hydrolase [unclassified Variovorax]|uniref:alpha/beta fold hydrolase n=1 Tax=unclassified Variovorax TaxID=663243 RepID=UPI0025785A4A|nr:MULTISPECIES: alpha/beta hydrolase [unclassified Variovorax]MDM0086080.1 alpha/beta hydrolase [Variovorax sp. J22G40]MDM0145663.1 alpha/beta hydrolase [Variovorax sp. J2P1-31]